MKENHVVLVDDNKQLVNGLADVIESETKGKYLVDRFFDAKSAIKYIDEEIDQNGDNLVMVGSDERLIGMQGHEFLQKLTKTHPLAKKMIFSAWSDVDPLVAMANMGINGFVNKQDQDSAGDPLINKILSLVSDWEKEDRIELDCGSVTVKQATTLYEKKAFSKTRFKIYTRPEVLNKSRENLRDEEWDHKMEWDHFDIGGLDELVVKRGVPIRYIVAMKNGECLGGSRIIEGFMPLEYQSVCIEDGFGFKEGEPYTVDHLRKKGVYTRESSRFIIDEDWKKERSNVLIGLCRVIDQSTADKNFLFCSSREKHLKLYSSMGFEIIGPRMKYTLHGRWYPMMRDRLKSLTDPDSIPGISKALIKRALEPIEGKERWAENANYLDSAAIEKGFYYAQK